MKVSADINYQIFLPVRTQHEVANKLHTERSRSVNMYPQNMATTIS